MSVTFLERAVRPAFERRTVAVPPGCERAYNEAEWRDAVVVVARGEIDLESSAGASCRFGAGDILWLVGLPLRWLRNPGREPAVLIAVSRAGSDEFSSRPPSNPT